MARRAEFSWALFEWARNPYVIVVGVYIFGPYFAREVIGDPVRGQALLGYANIIAGVSIAVLAPILGAIADVAGRRKPWIAGFTGALCLGAACLAFATPKAEPALIAFVMALIALNGTAFELTAVFHSSMLPDLAPRNRIGGLSGLGLALGNAGALIVLVAILVAAMNERLVGPLIASWLLLFALPLFLFVPDAVPTGISIRQAVERGLARLFGTLSVLRHHRNIARYLIARMIYTDGKTGILIFSGVYASGTFGWKSDALAAYGILLSIFAFFGGLIGGWIDDRFGSKTAVQVSILGTASSITLAILQSPTAVFGIWPYDPTRDLVLPLPLFKTLPEALYVFLAVFTAMSITAAYASSRTFLARLAPREMIVQFFGIYALSGTATSWLSPLLVGVVTSASGSQRIGFATTIALLFIGFAILWNVEDAER